MINQLTKLSYPDFKDESNPDYNPWESMSPQEVFEDSKLFLIDYYSSQIAHTLICHDLTKELKWHQGNKTTCSFDKQSIPLVAKEILEYRIDRIKKTKAKFKKFSSPSMRGKAKVKFSYKNSDEQSSHLNHSIDYKKNQITYYKGAKYDTYIHEIDHIATLGNNGIMPYSKVIMNEYPLNDIHLDDYSEKHARTVSVKYLLYKFGICNPINETITAQHLTKLQEYSIVNTDPGNDLLELLSDEPTIHELSQLLNIISLQELNDDINNIV